LRRKLAGLVIGNRRTWSLGRVAFWLVFGMAVYFWFRRPVAEFPPTLAETLCAVLAYNLGGKFANNFNRRVRREGGGEDDRDR
jgi:hypothetical protein